MEESREAGKKRGRFFTRGSSPQRGSGEGRAVPRPDPRCLAQSLVFPAVAAWTFYRRIPAFFLLLPLSVPVYRHAMRRRRQKEERVLLLQFQELLGSLLTGIRAGYSAENAFRESWQDMAFLYGEESRICRELVRINAGVANHIPLEHLLLEFADRSGAEEIREFAEVFSIAKRSGGNLPTILERTIHIIQEKIGTENEIQILLSSKRMESGIMDAVPFVLAGYLSVTSPGFFDPLYGTARGIAVTSGCLVLYLAALVLSEKITDIQV